MTDVANRIKANGQQVAKPTSAPKQQLAVPAAAPEPTVLIVRPDGTMFTAVSADTAVNVAVGEKAIWDVDDVDHLLGNLGPGCSFEQTIEIEDIRED